MFQIDERFRERLLIANRTNNLRVCRLAPLMDEDNQIVRCSLITDEREFTNNTENIPDIGEWLAQNYNVYLPVTWAANQFVEMIAPTSTFHLFETMVGPEEQVLARFTFDGHGSYPGNCWEVMYEQNQYGDSESQFIEYDYFDTAFAPADEEAKAYREVINSIYNQPLNYYSPDMSIANSELRLPCDCYTHELAVSYDKDTDCFELAYWQRGKGEQPWSWKTRLKMIWDIIATGNPYADMIILKRKNMYKLYEYIGEFMRHGD